jgi:hypothetical protein
MAENWDAAIGVLIGDDQEDFHDWLVSGGLGPDTNQAFKAYRDGRWRPDRVIASLISEMDPTLPPTFCGFPISPDSLPDLARNALAAGAEKAAVERLLASKALKAYASLDKCSDLLNIDATWQRMYRYVEQAAEQLKMPWEVKAAVVQRGAVATLLAVVDGEYANDLALQAERSATAAARTREWFARLQPPDDPALGTATHWLTIVSAPIAGEEYVRQRAEDEDRRNRQRAEDEDRRNTVAASMRRGQTLGLNGDTPERMVAEAVATARRLQKRADRVWPVVLLWCAAPFAAIWILTGMLPPFQIAPLLTGLGLMAVLGTAWAAIEKRRKRVHTQIVGLKEIAAARADDQRKRQPN